MATDRYLISINKKQLLGTQAQAFEGGCFCAHINKGMGASGSAIYEGSAKIDSVFDSPS